MQTLLSDDEIASLNVDFETLQPSDILAWALEKSGLEKLAIASAFQTGVRSCPQKIRWVR